MRVLEYVKIDPSGLEAKYEKVKNAILRDDFYSAQVKKLGGSEYYAARLDHTNRLLLQVRRYRDQSYALFLEVIRNHDYSGSRFLRGARVREENIIKESIVASEIRYINPGSSYIHFLEKVLSFDDAQEDIYKSALPLIIIGPAGSGKTVVVLEYIKNLSGRILYISVSDFLVRNASNIYYCNGYENDAQEVEFLSYRELLETIKIPGNIISYNKFKTWCLNHKYLDIDKLWEEINGTLTGSDVTRPFLGLEDYLSLGIKQSLYNLEERRRVYSIFIKYLDYLKIDGLVDINIVSYEYLKFVTPKYDYIVIDEVQDLTNVQIKLLLILLRQQQFIMCGDANQVVYPNFFSWSRLKSFFYKSKVSSEITFLRNNYRNSKAIVEMANKILLIKQYQFGSIDKESNYLMKTISETQGKISLVDHSTTESLNAQTKRSVKYAVIVLMNEHKELARKHFETPLIFTVQEAKGLEYDNIIMFNLISSEVDKFEKIASGINSSDLKGEISYGRSRDKRDKSLESYKFYINSFYVAVTRAIVNIYIIEETESSFLELFNLGADRNGILGRVATAETESNANEIVSSIEEWQKEAFNLENQGKIEQAQLIRDQILKEQDVPWEILTKEKLEEMVNNKTISIEEAIGVLEYFIIYRKYAYITQFREQGFKTAFNIVKAKNIVRKKYFTESTEEIIRNTKRYGINYRNRFNLTALMVGCRVANVKVVEYLVGQGADVNLIDNNKLTALQVLLQDLSQIPYENGMVMHYQDSEKITKIYFLLSSNGMSLKIGDQLIRLVPSSMEFFLYNFLVAVVLDYSHYVGKSYVGNFQAKILSNSFGLVNEQILKLYRRKREYITSVLARNELDKGEKKLFLRIAHGKYILNPDIEIMVNGKWELLYGKVTDEEIQKIIDANEKIRTYPLINKEPAV